MQYFSIKLVDSKAERPRLCNGIISNLHLSEQVELSEVVRVHGHHCGNVIDVIINCLLHMPHNFEVCCRELEEMNSSSSINSHQERYIVVTLTILTRAFLVIQRLEGLVESLLLRCHGLNSVKLLNLTLQLVKIHNNGLVVGLAQAVKECTVLRQKDSIDAAHCIRHIVEELTPHPISIRTDRIDVAVRVFSRSEITRLGRSTDIYVI